MTSVYSKMDSLEYLRPPPKINLSENQLLLLSTYEPTR